MLLYLPQTNIIYSLSKHLLPTAVKKNAGSRGSILSLLFWFPLSALICSTGVVQGSALSHPQVSLHLLTWWSQLVSWSNQHLSYADNSWIHIYCRPLSWTPDSHMESLTHPLPLDVLQNLKRLTCPNNSRSSPPTCHQLHPSS